MPKLQRKAHEIELTDAYQLLQVYQPFIVNKAKVSTHSVVGEIARPSLVRGRALDSVDPGTAVREPASRLRGKTWIPGHHLGARPVARMESRAQEHDVRGDSDAGSTFGSLQLANVDVPQVGNVAKVETEGRTMKPLEAHLVDTRTRRAEMKRCVDVRSDVLHHRQLIDRIGVGVGLGSKPLMDARLMSCEGFDEGRREAGMRRHSARNLESQIHEAAGTKAIQ